MHNSPKLFLKEHAGAQNVTDELAYRIGVDALRCEIVLCRSPIFVRQEGVAPKIFLTYHSARLVDRLLVQVLCSAVSMRTCS